MADIAEIQRQGSMSFADWLFVLGRKPVDPNICLVKKDVERGESFEEWLGLHAGYPATPENEIKGDWYYRQKVEWQYMPVSERYMNANHVRFPEVTLSKVTVYTKESMVLRGMVADPIRVVSMGRWSAPEGGHLVGECIGNKEGPFYLDTGDVVHADIGMLDLEVL